MFQRMHGFDVRTNEQERTITYTCKTCGKDEHGGGIPNPGLFGRMKQHLREGHDVEKPDNLKRQEVSDGADLVQVWFGLDS